MKRPLLESVHQSITALFGAEWQVQIQMPQPNLELTYKHQTDQPDGDAGDPYNGYDRFGRTADMRWSSPIT